MPLVFDPESKNKIKPILWWFWNSMGLLNMPQVIRRRQRLEEYLKNYLVSEEFQNLLKSENNGKLESLPKVRFLNYCLKNLDPVSFTTTEHFPGYYSKKEHCIYMCSNFIDSEKMVKENFIREFQLSNFCKFIN